MENMSMDALIELGKKLGKLEAENEQLKAKIKEKGEGENDTAPQQTVVTPVEEPTPSPNSPAGMILQLLTDKHPQEYNAHMIALELGIAKHIALDTMEELTKNGFLKKANVGRFVAKNSRAKLQKASLLGSEPIQTPRVADRTGMYENSIKIKVLDYVESHPDYPWSGVALVDVLPQYNQIQLTQTLGHMSKEGKVRMVATGFHCSLGSNIEKARDELEKIKNLDHDPLQKAIYQILSADIKPHSIKDIIDQLPPIPPMDKITDKQVARAIQWLTSLGKVTSPIPGKYSKRLGPRSKDWKPRT